MTPWISWSRHQKDPVWDAAVEAWAAQVMAIAKEAVQDAKEVLEEKSINYTLVELGEELEVYCNRG